MNDWVEKVFSKVKQLYAKAEELTQEEVGIPLSEESLNALLKRYVTDKVRMVGSLEADLKEHDFSLRADITAKGVNAKLSGDFEVVSFVFNDETQRMVFSQLTPTRIDSLSVDAWYKKPLVNVALFFIKHVLRRDFLGYALERFDVATCKEELIYIDVSKYFDPNSRVIKQLKRFQISHGFIKNERLQLKSRINLRGFLNSKKGLITEADMPEDYGVENTQLIFTAVD